ncbi:unnamed protein product [Allacma fusca]|uniref:Uncharacterized protein n=1 Tax=Allacma fusca TaxID=39272 RepID=A0A8J2LE53_9HEXA|nr:unnamed protein product [Allacma fusca]
MRKKLPAHMPGRETWSKVKIGTSLVADPVGKSGWEVSSEEWVRGESIGETQTGWFDEDYIFGEELVVG